MQTKNVNLLQANSSATVEAPLADPGSSSMSSEAVVKMTNGSAPPLPPRGNTQGPPSRPKSIMHMQLDAGVFSPYKPVPLPKPVPPPYRQPPQVPIYSNPSVPGTMQPSTSTEALNMHFPIKRKTQVLVEEDEAELDCGETSAAVAGGCDVRIPTLAEVVKMKPRPKSANVVRPVERPSKPKAQQAWTEDNIQKQTTEGGGTKQRKLVVADDDRWEGEPLLVRSRSGPLYPCGIDNQGADDIGYVPSQPHQKNAGARGQVLLEGCGGEPDSAAQENLYRAFCVTTEVDTVVRGPETSELSIRDACSRMYPSAKTIHSSLQNLKVSSSMEQPEVKRQRPKMRISTAEGVEVGPTQPYYHLKDMRSGEDEGKVYNRVSQATKDEVEGVVVYGATKVLGAVELCARSPAQQGNPAATTKAVAESKRMSSTSSESGHGTMQTGAPSSGTLNTSSESAPTNTNHVETSKEKKAESFNLNESSFSDHFSVTPPLPPLSPSTTPPTSPRTHPTKHKRRTPDIVETTRDVGNMRLSANRKANSSSKGVKSSSGLNHSDFRSWINKQGRLYVQGQSRSSTSPYKYSGRSQRIPLGGRVSVDTNDGEVTSTTTGLDLDSLLDEAEMSSVNSSTTDDASQSTSIAEIGSIRKQLESLEGMYSEVMRVLGLQNGLPPRLKGGQETKFKKNFASSPASSTTTTTTAKGHVSSKAPVGGRMGSSKTSDRHLQSERGKRVKEKGIGKRFQRLESHVVTLARSVAHLSSEMRTQHMMFQELENLRQEVAQLHDAQLLLRSRVGQGTNAAAAAANGRGNSGGSREWDNFRSSIPSLTNPSRVKKLTHFFGDEPPLLRLFLKKLGYEKYACLFESEKIGIIELPYLTEERLQKIGIPMGPRMRILQEAQMSFRQEHFNIYIV